MKREIKFVLSMLALLIVVVLLAAIVIYNTEAKAEALPSPEASDMLVLTGDFRLSDAPMDLYVAECLRVDVALSGPAGHLSQGDALSGPAGHLSQWERQGVWADLTLPYVPPSIFSVALFDGWHLIHGTWEQIGESTLRLFFWPEDVARLDGTVGIYLVILAERGESDAAD